MRTIVNGKINIWADYEEIDALTDFCEQFGEVNYNDDTETLVITVENGYEDDWFNNAINAIVALHNATPDSNILLEYVVEDMDSGKTKLFECQYKKGAFRQRETNWSYDSIDSDDSFDELEEEGIYDIDEDEYCDYSHRDREGRNKFTEKEFSEWEYIDIDE